MDTKVGKAVGVRGGGGGMNWETGIDIYTLICIKWITNKNLLYKKDKQMIIDKGVKGNTLEQRQSFQQVCWNSWTSTCKK